jgi:Tfp pilus assembly PilM family ATPase
MVEVNFENSGVSLVGAIELPFTDAIIRQGKLKNIAAIANHITEARLKALPYGISGDTFSLSLPETITYFGHITVPTVPRKELKHTVSEIFAKQNDLKIEDYYIDGEIIKEQQNVGFDILVAAASLENVKEILKISKLLDITPVAIEPAPIANGRVELQYPSQNIKTISICIDYESTFITLWQKDRLMGIKTLHEIDLSSILEENEISKPETGYERIASLHLDSNALKKSILEITKNILELVSEKSSTPANDIPISKIFLTGPGAYLPKIDQVIEREFRITTIVKTIRFTNHHEIGPEFITAYGLAMRSEV